ncbi:MAG: hypothetical protein CHACPFDD_03072 [Phycisphaerae bacterium]|nr:hypothetical protein [Phycisphaerae bacterium]
MVLGLILALLPTSWTGCLRSPMQALVWLQAGVDSAANSARDALPAGSAARLSPDESERLKRRCEELERQVRHQELRVGDLEEQVAVLSGLRGQFSDAGAKLVLAHVVAADAAPGRESLLIDRGASSRDAPIAVGQWVAAGGSDAAADDGRTVLMRQSLIGVVSEVFPYTSRVQLATDRHFGPRRVRMAAALADGALSPLERDCLLYGAGGGKLLIREAPGDFFKQDYRFILVPRDAQLPGQFLLGELVASAPVKGAPLVFNLSGRLLVDAASVRAVYVIAPH